MPSLKNGTGMMFNIHFYLAVQRVERVREEPQANRTNEQKTLTNEYIIRTHSIFNL